MIAPGTGLMASMKHHSDGAMASHPTSASYSRYGMIINSELHGISNLKAGLNLVYFADTEVASCW